MTPEDFKLIGDAACVSVAASHDCIWPGNLLAPRLWEDFRVELQRRFRRSTGEPQAVLTVELSPPPAQTQPVEAQGDPVAWQHRIRPNNNYPWTGWIEGQIANNPGEWEVENRPLYAAPQPAAPVGEVERLRGLIRWAHDTLYEINPSNYDHDEVCKLNDASVEVILGLAVELGEKHGKTDEWWATRRDALHGSEKEEAAHE